jgi:hypothetical protein
LADGGRAASNHAAMDDVGDIGDECVEALRLFEVEGDPSAFASLAASLFPALYQEGAQRILSTLPRRKVSTENTKRMADAVMFLRSVDKRWSDAEICEVAKKFKLSSGDALSNAYEGNRFDINSELRRRGYPLKRPRGRAKAVS